MDDSDEETSQNGRAVAKILQHHQIENLWVDRSYRLKFAGAIAKNSAVPESVTQFALLGDARCGIRTGAARNTLLLLAAGKRSVQVDDDTICRITPSPGRKPGMVLSSENCNQYWYYNSPDKAFKYPQYEDIDFLSLHESLLGTHPGTLIEEQPKVNIDRLEGRLLEALNDRETRTVVTYLGGLGDSGMFRHWQRLCAQGDSFRRLIEEASAYQNNVRTRQLFRGPAQLTIGDGPFCMAMNIGMDTRQLLPPFMPVQRRQDGVFGLLLRLCFKRTCRGYVPYAILHDPPTRSARIGLSHALSTGPLRTNDILEAVLYSHNRWPMNQNSSYNLRITGDYLLDLSRLPPKRFKGQLRKICLQLIRRQINYFERCIYNRIDVPQYWQRDARRVVSNFQKLMLQENIGLPSDLMGNASERLTLFQQLIGKFGQLLIHWPKIWETAIHLRHEQDWGTITTQRKGAMDVKEWDRLSNDLLNQAKDHIGAAKKAQKIKRKGASIVAPFFLLRQKVNKNEQIRGMMATYPARKKQLLHSIDSIIDQVQDLFIYMNDYNFEEYEKLRKNLPDKCVLLWDREEAGNLMDSGKFYMCSKLTGYHLTLDDDLIYPPNFISRIVRNHKKLSNDNTSPLALGIHGRKISNYPMHSYFKDTEIYHFQRGLKSHTKVDILGTGGVLFHRDDLDMSMERCKSHGMADIWFSISCLKQGLDRYVIAHPDNWVRQQPVEKSLYQKHLGNDQQHTEILNSFDWDSETHAERDTNSSH
ncbi:glycosyltransferase family 2 protein [Fodinibius roseus]|uniref:glycosyltransferase family 2 protein n=1 Tax=Fodinibius roseus TaxID=1194090 RepID=UPI001114F0E1|nr:glycosyltransferase family 2 protein [Fodinibius roseus]